MLLHPGGCLWQYSNLLAYGQIYRQRWRWHSALCEAEVQPCLSQNHRLCLPQSIWLTACRLHICVTIGPRTTYIKCPGPFVHGSVCQSASRAVHQLQYCWGVAHALESFIKHRSRRQVQHSRNAPALVLLGCCRPQTRVIFQAWVTVAECTARRAAAAIRGRAVPGKPAAPT